MQRFGIDGAAGSWLDLGGDGFAPFDVGYTNDGGLQHGGVTREDVFDFLGVNVSPPRVIMSNVSV